MNRRHFIKSLIAASALAPLVRLSKPFDPCRFCIKMVSDSCRNTRCVHQTYVSGVLSRQRGMTWHMDPK